MHRIEVAQSLVDRTIRLDDVPQQHDGNERHEKEPRGDQRQPEHHAGQGRVDDEKPPGHAELACEPMPQTAFETRNGDPDHDRRHDPHHDRHDDRRQTSTVSVLPPSSMMPRKTTNARAVSTANIPMFRTILYGGRSAHRNDRHVLRRF
jgi:hypothetical protein